MKRCLTLLLALVLALSLAACGAKSAGSDTMTGSYNGYDSTKEDYDFTATDDEAEDAGAWNGDGQEKVPEFLVFLIQAHRASWRSSPCS